MRVKARRGQGDREKAIELLRDTNLKYKEIELITGVPNGSLTALALMHRPPEVRQANRRRAGTENLLARHELRADESGSTEENKEPVVQPTPAPTPVAEVIVPKAPSKGLSRTMLFSYEAKTSTPISRYEALEEISHIRDMIGSATGEEFHFTIKVDSREIE
jgi:hypothetical protein